MKTVCFTLDIDVEARDEEEALEIAKACRLAIVEGKPQPYKITMANVEIDKLYEL